MKKSVICFLAELPTSIYQQVQNQDKQFFPDPWSKSVWDASHNQSDYLITYISEGEQLTAWSLVKVNKLEGLLHLLKILVIPDGRHQGFAQVLLKETCSWGKEILINRCYLEVDKGNEVAIEFYRKQGFKILHEIKRFYSDGRDALTMELNY